MWITDLDYHDTGDVRADLREQFLRSGPALSSPPIGPVYRALIAEAQSDPALRATLHERFLLTVERRTLDRITRAQHTGELVADVNLEFAAEVLCGTLYYRHRCQPARSAKTPSTTCWTCSWPPTAPPGEQAQPQHGEPERCHRPQPPDHNRSGLRNDVAALVTMIANQEPSVCRPASLAGPDLPGSAGLSRRCQRCFPPCPGSSESDCAWLPQDCGDNRGFTPG